MAISPLRLDALEQFFSQMVSTSGLAFIVTQHGAAKNKYFSLKTIAKFTAMEVLQVEDTMEIRPNVVYLLPPNKDFDIRLGQIVMSDLEMITLPALPVDRFISVLVNNFGSKTIVVLFSVEGTDGLSGIAAINQLNGMVLVEANKLSLGLSGVGIPMDKEEYILPIQEMPLHIIEHIKFHSNHTKESMEEERSTLFAILKQATGVDFGSYKQASLLRRIQRRMSMQGMQSLQDYNRLLYESPEEIMALQKDFLIGVTQFFRDSEAFAIISDKVIPAVFERHAEDKQIRIWVAGCSTGEEVYSLAILFQRNMEVIGEEYQIKIFATDLDKDSIQHASKGIYSESIAKSICPEYLTDYFTLYGSEYQINKEIRQMVIFAHHNILKDPPFIQLDLVACRNMLIYLQPEMQRKVISLFHFSLKPDGFLFLGPSETLGKLTNLFKVLDSKWNIYQYKEMKQLVSANSFSKSESLNEQKQMHKNTIIARLKESERILKIDNIYMKLIEDYVAACIIIDDNNDIIHINGNASQYLIIPKGKPSHNLFKMIPEQLSVAVRTALHKVRKENKEIVYKGITFKNLGKSHTLNLITKPFHFNLAHEKLIIIFFEEKLVKKAALEKGKAEEGEQQNGLFYQADDSILLQIKDLEQELFQVKESLQATIEELESSNEEIQASNEELIVANEELQSTNEELQSVNEELMAVNNEYQYKIHELTEMNNDMSNLFISSNIATLFLDSNMNIRKFTPAITLEINLMDLDIGRPLSDISHHLKYDYLLADSRKVLHTFTTIKKEIQSKSGKWYSLKILPYYTSDHVVEGVVITLIDISEVKQANENLLVLSYAIQQSPGCIVITDTEKRIRYLNTKYAEQTGYELIEVFDTTLELYSNDLSSDQLLDIWEHVQTGEKWVGELLNKRKNGETFAELVTLLPIKDQLEQIIYYLKVSEDITEKKQTLEMLHKSDMLSVVGQLAAGIAHEIRNPLTALKGFTKLLEPDTKKKNYISIMTSELDRIETIINELLMLARPQMLHFEKKDVLVILQDVIMLLEGQAILNNVEIVTKFADDIPLINCVQNQLKQVFINIVKNGIEAMPQGGNLIIKVKLLEESKILISFTDQGIGISEDRIPKLGDPFYSTKENGTGLGLMVSYKIIENHHGTITINSTVGKGSTFDIIIKIM
jgi:two-component system CheB/CheR fusion protein